MISLHREPPCPRRRDRRRIVAAVVVAITGLAVAPAPSAAPVVVAAGGTCAASTGTADLNHLFGGQVDEYAGLDALRPYPLPDGRVLWLFQDAFFSPAATHVARLADAHFAHNAALVQDGTCFRALHGPTAPAAAGDQCPLPGRASYVGGELTMNCRRWFWPMGGAMGSDGLLHVFFALVGNAARTGANTGAAPDGAWVARIDPSSLAVVGFAPAPDDDGRVLYGWAVENDGAYTYLFGHSYDQFDLPDHTSPDPHLTFLARVPRGRFDLVPEYWAGWGWSSARADAQPVHAGAAGRSDALQPRLVDGVWVSISKPGDWFGTDVVLDTAPAPEGPWTRVRSLTLPTRTTDGATNTYQPHLLPWRSPLGNLIVTVSHNAWAMNPVAYDRPPLYRPSFFEIEPPAAMPRTTLAPTTPRLGFLASPPVRAIDTRRGQPLVAGEVRRVALDGLVDPAAAAAAIDLIGVEPRTSGFVTAWSCDEPRPWTSNLNLVAGVTQAAFALVRLSASHELCVFSSADVDIVVDVFGSYADRDRVGAASYRAVGPARVLDTRGTAGAVPGRPLRIAFTPGTTAVAINLAATEASGAGFVTAYPCDRPRPATSNLNVLTGETISNHAQVGVSASGELCIVSSMATHLVVDLVGAFSDTTDGWWYRAAAPTRLADSREGVGVPVGPSTVAGPGAPAVPAASRPALTALPDEARALVLTAVAVDPRADGWLTVAPCVAGDAYETVVVNTTAWRTMANLTIVPTCFDSGHDVCMFSMMVAHHVLDLAGWFEP